MEYYFKMDVKNTRKDRGLRLFISGHGQETGCCEHVHKTSGFVQRGELLN